MIDELLKVGGTKLLVPCVLAVMLVALAKGLFEFINLSALLEKIFLIFGRIETTTTSSGSKRRSVTYSVSGFQRRSSIY